VTVLFADVKGSMELAEGLDPETWHGVLDRFFQSLSDGVHRFDDADRLVDATGAANFTPLIAAVRRA
jgi:class 3 adenylate cyclase